MGEKRAGRILVVDDDPDIRLVLTKALGRRGYEVEEAQDAESALAKAGSSDFDVIILDIRLPGMDGMDALERFRLMDPDAVVIMITAHGTREVALEAVNKGAYDFFTKPFKIEELEVMVRRALERRLLLKEINELKRRLEAREEPFPEIIGRSKAILELKEAIKKVKDTDVTVLIHGESGTGKELVADAIHMYGKRKDRPFVKINCAAIPETLLESELFGHEKGAFTGATSRKPGKFEQAHGGSIFLDEIGDMPLKTQAKMLRVLQEKKVERLGGTQTIDIDVRIIAATNQDLKKAIKEGRFREDLYFRLSVFPIYVPPLRERKEDIPILAQEFLYAASKRFGHSVRVISNEAMSIMEAYRWPGNVRELQNCIERAVVLCDGDTIGPEHLPSHIKGGKPVEKWDADTEGSLDEIVDNFERHLIVDALKKSGGVQSRAAQILGISERSLWHRVKKLSIDPKSIKESTKIVE